MIFQAHAFPVTLSLCFHIWDISSESSWYSPTLHMRTHHPCHHFVIMSSFDTYEAHLAHEDTPPPGLVLHLHLLDQLGSNLGVIMTISFILKIIILSSWSLLVSSRSLFMWCWSAPSQGRPQASRWTSQLCTSWSGWGLGCFYSFIYLQPRWPEIKANLHIYSRYFDLIVPKNNICFISSLPFNWHFFRTQKKIQVFRKKLSPISTPCRWSVRYLDSLHQTLSAC